MNPPLVQLHEASKRYGDKWAVRKLTLEIPAGELFAFLGPNGAGKTTTIKMMTGLLRPTEGKVIVAGHDMSGDSPEVRRQIGFIPDQPYLYDKLTGRDFLRFTREIYGLSGAADLARENEMIEVFETASFVDDLIETYSHGMRQRIAFASALLRRPKVLIVDEPMVGLDPKSTRLVKDLLRDVVKNGATVFMSTHALGIAEEVADRVGIIHKGRLVRLGSLEELRREVAQAGSLEDFFLQVTAESAA